MTISELNFFKKGVDTLRDDVYKLQKAPSEEEFMLMRTRVETAENTISNTSKKASEALKGLKALKNQFGKGGE